MTNTNQTAALADELMLHCLGAVEQLYYRSIQEELVAACIGASCSCGAAFNGTDADEVRHQWAEHAAAAIIAKHLPDLVSDGLVEDRLAELDKGTVAVEAVAVMRRQATRIAQLEARIEKLTGADISGIWEQASENHERYSATDSDEGDLRFLTLGLCGEAGELANFVKKRWRDGEPHQDDCRKECADVLAYTMMVAQRLGMSPADLIAVVAEKQAVFVAKMNARAALNEKD